MVAWSGRRPPGVRQGGNASEFAWDWSGISESEIGEAGGYRYLLCRGCYVVAAPIVLVATVICGALVG